MKQSSSRAIVITLIIAVIGALAAAWYFLWYIPHTPVYTLRIIQEAVENKDPDTVFHHVDTKSIVKNIVDREGDTYVDTSTPLGKGLVAATKAFAPALLEDVARQYIMDPDSFKAQPADTDSNSSASTKSNDKKSMIDRIQDGELFKQRDLEIIGLKSDDDGETATITATVRNNKTQMTKDIRLLARRLGDGTWVIYDIPDIENLYTVTRK